MKKVTKKFKNLVVSAGLFILLISCARNVTTVDYNFNKINNRVWIAEDFWAIPMEDWQVNNGRLECTGKELNSRLNLLAYVLNDSESDFNLTFKMGLIHKGENEGTAGIRIGAREKDKADVKADCFFGSGINGGISTSGFAFLDQQRVDLPVNFDWKEFNISLTGEKKSGSYKITMKIIQPDRSTAAELSFSPDNKVSGLLQLVNNFHFSNSKINGPDFWFDDVHLEGSKITYKEENKFGPILWTMYTLSKNTLKLSVQFPPLSAADTQQASFQIKKEGQWETMLNGSIDPAARNVVFKMADWDETKDTEFRIIYKSQNVFGEGKTYSYDGTIRKDPVDRPLQMGALTCQFHTGFPYTPVVNNLNIKNPDILYFSGDQIYQANGGYPIKSFPEDAAILSYLGKWYMFGWAFGDLMRNRPTVCTPDDHDVFQGNLWGESGRPQPVDKFKRDDLGGFAQTVKTINVVNRTQCSHLPDPYDPTTIDRGMIVWYTSMDYGRISFAIVSDRIFKSGPDQVATWKGRKDLMITPLKNPSVLEKQGLELLGKRQEDFMRQWIKEWNNVDMKVLLSQTVFANPATHHGTYNGYAFGDLDSGGWPKKGRDHAISIMRKGFVFHIAGDQHVASIVQYGINDYRDAGWCFDTPPISISFSRWFRPDELQIPVKNRPDHNLPNTGEYKDAFGNLNYVYAIGNPGNFQKVPDRYEFEQAKMAGFGYVTFDQKKRTITMDSYRFMANLAEHNLENNHAGWPLTISQFDNYGRKAVAWLPVLKVNGESNPVVEIVNEKTGELEYIVRIKGNEFTSKVFEDGSYSIKIGYPERNMHQIFRNIHSEKGANQSELIVKF